MANTRGASARTLNKRDLALEVHRLAGQGKTNAEISQIIGKSSRYVRELKSYAREVLMDLGSYTPPPPKGLHELSQEAKAMVLPYLAWREHEQEHPWDGCELDDELIEAVLEGFTLFFNRFSGREVPEHAKEWIREAFRNTRVLLNVPPRHAKSTYLSVWVPMYLVVCDRNIQILVVSQTNEFAQKFASEIAEHFESDIDMIEMFGQFVPSNPSWTWAPGSGELVVEGRERLVLPGDRTIQVRGARQQILGMESDWIVCDDPDDHDIVFSERERERLREWFDSRVITRLNPGGHAVVIGQRLHVNDLYGYLAKKRRTRLPGQPKLWKHISYPAVIRWPSEDGAIEPEVLWPEVWSFERLMTERYEDLGYATFETMYQQNPMPAGKRLVQPSWITGDGEHLGCLDTERPAGVGIKLVGETNFLPMVRVISVDPSPTKNWGFVVADVVYNLEQFNASVIHIEGTPLQAREGLNRIDELMMMYQPDYLVIEDSAVSKWIIQDPWYETAKSRVRIIKHTTTAKSKGDASYGIQSLAVDFEFGRIRFPYGDAEGRSITEQFLSKELYVYPEGETDDELMALWFIKYVHRGLVPVEAMVTKIDWGGAYDGTGFDSAWS